MDKGRTQKHGANDKKVDDDAQDHLRDDRDKPYVSGKERGRGVTSNSSDSMKINRTVSGEQKWGILSNQLVTSHTRRHGYGYEWKT